MIPLKDYVWITPESNIYDLEKAAELEDYKYFHICLDVYSPKTLLKMLASLNKKYNHLVAIRFFKNSSEAQRDAIINFIYLNLKSNFVFCFIAKDTLEVNIVNAHFSILNRPRVIK